MTYEEYCTKGYYYSDYLKLSQWQRWRYIRYQRKKGILKGPKIFWLWQVDDEGCPMYPFPKWLNPKRWGFGFDSSQMCELLWLGFFGIYWDMK